MGPMNENPYASLLLPGETVVVNPRTFTSAQNGWNKEGRSGVYTSYIFDIVKGGTIAITLKQLCLSEGEAGFRRITNISEVLRNAKQNLRITNYRDFKKGRNVLLLAWVD